MHRRAATLKGAAGAGRSNASFAGDESSTLADSSVEQSVEDLLRKQVSDKDREVERVRLLATLPAQGVYTGERS
jgi:hypothetical protein